jgi:hypothetical protein
MVHHPEDQDFTQRRKGAKMKENTNQLQLPYPKFLPLRLSAFA